MVKLYTIFACDQSLNTDPN